MCVTKRINDLDLLHYGFISAGIEFDREEYFKANKKCFRRELTDNLSSVFDRKWSFGLKSVFDLDSRSSLMLRMWMWGQEKSPVERANVGQDDVGFAASNEIKPQVPQLRFQDTILEQGPNPPYFSGRGRHLCV